MREKKQRIAAICATLVQNPGKLFPLGYFQTMFDIAKSGLSEDIAVIKATLEDQEIGQIETVRGARGGVRYLPRMTQHTKSLFIQDMIEKMSDTSRILPGGYVYLADLFFTPYYVDGVAQIMTEWFLGLGADFIVTVETKGIPLAMSVARFLNLPVVVARRESKLTDGSIFSVNYLSGSSRRLQTMSIPRRMLKAGSSAIVVDDFIGGGGTIQAIQGMLGEFDINVAAIGAAIVNRYPQKKKISQYQSVFMLEELSETKIEIVSCQ